jgi:hypothetical protein
LKIALRNGKIKSHEISEIAATIAKQIRNSYNSKVADFNKNFERIKSYKKHIIFEVNSHSFNVKNKRRNVVEISINIADVYSLNQKDFRLLIHLFISEPSHLSELLSISIFGLKEGIKYPIFYHKFRKVKKTEVYTFLTLSEKRNLLKYYSNPIIQKLVLQYLYPTGDNICRVTLDKLRKDLPVKKSLRIERFKDEYIKITEVLKNDISNEDFNEIIESNNIADFYCGTSDIEGNLTYMVFDLDVSDFFKLRFSDNVIWKFLLNVCAALIEVIKKLGFKNYPLIKWSANRGLHILLRYNIPNLRDDLNRVNLQNFFYQFPGLWELIKNFKSPLKSMSSLSRLLADSIVTYLLYLGSIEIPSEIQEVFGNKLHPKELFRLNVNTNDLAILFDTSPNSNGVIRTGFSVHPTTGLVSIPIFDCETGTFFEDIFDVQTLKEEAKMSSILYHIEKKDYWYDRYLQFKKSTIITKGDIENLFLPNSLLPIIAIVLRFSRRYVFERSVASFYYWYNYYLIKFYFEYIENMSIITTQENKFEIFNLIQKITEECKIVNSKYVIELERKLLFDNKISGSIFIDRLKGLYHFEFNYRINPKPILEKQISLIKNFLLEKAARRQFMEEFKALSLIITEIFSRIITNPKMIFERRKKALIILFLQLKQFSKVYKKVSQKIDKSDEIMVICFDLWTFIHLYNVFALFLKNYYRFDKIRLINT